MLNKSKTNFLVRRQFIKMVFIAISAISLRCSGASFEQIFQQQGSSVIYRQMFRIDLPDSATGPIESNYVPYRLFYSSSNVWTSARYRIQDWPRLTNASPIGIFFRAGSECYFSEAGSSRYWNDTGNTNVVDAFTLRQALSHRTGMIQWILNMGIVEASIGTIHFQGDNFSFIGSDDKQLHEGSVVLDKQNVKILEYQLQKGEAIRHIEYRFASSNDFFPSEIRAYRKFGKSVEWHDLVWICEIATWSLNSETINGLDPFLISSYYSLGLLSTNTSITRYTDVGIFEKKPNEAELQVLIRDKPRSWSMPSLSVRNITISFFCASTLLLTVLVFRTIIRQK